MAGIGRYVGPLLEALVETVYPEHCVSCGRAADQVPWCDRGPVVKGLRFLDAPHLCRSCCNQQVGSDPVRLRLGWHGGNETEILGAVPTSATLVQWVGAWKYKGLRGLAWPLAGLMNGALARSGILRERDTLALVPVPLHRRRRRIRGFNQAELLARLVALEQGLPVLDGIVQRVGCTSQQARIPDPSRRMRNLAGAFGMVTEPGPGAPELVLVDDIITSGATCGELARTLRKGGWRVPLVIGLAAVRPGSKPRNGGSAGVSVDTV